MTTTSSISSQSEFFTALEKFQQVFDHHLEQLNKTDVIDSAIPQKLGGIAKKLHQEAVNVLPDGEEKDQILRHLTWCHKDTVSWIRLFTK